MEYEQKPRDEGGLGGLDIPLLGDTSQDIGSAFGVIAKEGKDKGSTYR